MASIESTSSLISDLPPSCIKFCKQKPEYFVVGTYFLHPSAPSEETSTSTAKESDDDTGAEEDDGAEIGGEKAQKRSGSLVLYRLVDDTLHLVSTTPTPDFSILDLKWSPHADLDHPLLAAATSTGSLVFFQLLSRHDDTTYCNVLLRFAAEGRVCDASTLVLFLAWHPTRTNTIGVTLSDGRVCLIEISDGAGSESGLSAWASVETTWHVKELPGHSLEAWVLAFAVDRDSEGKDVFSGGDDMVLQRSRRQPNQEGTLLWQDTGRMHRAGITFILPLTTHLILTGSYDDHIRLISAAGHGPRHVLAEKELGGGIWRLKILGEDVSRSSDYSDLIQGERGILILASCMHAGVRIVRLDRSQDGWEFEVVAKFTEHQSMNYASDVQPSSTPMRIVSTSFYDKLLSVWKFDPEGAQ